ncbi:MAG TPA: hypothetical protein VIJ12_02345 [Candidatus Baltobacteraceae bacterium]
MQLRTRDRVIEKIRERGGAPAEVGILIDQFTRSNEEAREKVHGGPFPVHLEALRNLINNTARETAKSKRQLDIVSDCVDYGSFFDPDRHETIVNVLRGLSRADAHIRMLAVGPIKHITGSAEFEGMSHEERMGNPDFNTYVQQYVTHLRDEGKNSAFAVQLGKHAASPEELFLWVKAFAAPGERPIEDLTKSLQRAQEVVYDSTESLSTRKEDGDALLACLWSREYYFQGVLADMGIIIKRGGSASPPVSMWLTPQDAVYILNTAGTERRGTAFSISLIKDDDFRRDKLEVLRSIFDRLWSETPDLPSTPRSA